MTNAMIVIHPDMDVKKATKKGFQEANAGEPINTIFVVNEKEIFLAPFGTDPRDSFRFLDRYHQKQYSSPSP